jgi:hypothetical protein
MDTEFITKLIILATAIVGLYKAATYRPRGKNEGDGKTMTCSPKTGPG